MFRVVHVGDDDVRTAHEAPSLADVPTGGGWTWIDILEPTADELVEVATHFGLDRNSRDDLIEAQPPKLEMLDGYWVLVVHALAVDELATRTVELDVVVGDDWIVTVHAEPLRSIEHVAQRILRPSFGVDDARHLAVRLVEFVAERYLPILDDLDSQVLDLEDLAIVGDPKVLPEILALRRDIAVLRRVLGPQRRTLEVFERTEHHMTDRAGRDLSDAVDHHARLVDSLESAHQMLVSVLDTYRGAAAERMNEVMKVLTVISSIFLPLTLVAGIYGMNFESMPELEQPWGYPAALLGMAAVGIAMWLYFVRRGFIGGPKVRDLAGPARAAGRVGKGLATAALVPIKVTTRATSQLLNGSDDDGR